MLNLEIFITWWREMNCQIFKTTEMFEPHFSPVSNSNFVQISAHVWCLCMHLQRARKWAGMLIQHNDWIQNVMSKVLLKNTRLLQNVIAIKVRSSKPLLEKNLTWHNKKYNLVSTRPTHEWQITWRGFRLTIRDVKFLLLPLECLEALMHSLGHFLGGSGGQWGDSGRGGNIWKERNKA